MNIVRIPRLLKQSSLLLALFSSLLLTACGGGGGGNSSTTSSVSSSASSHAFSSSPVSVPGSGVWPAVKVSASGTKSLKFDWTAPAGATYYKLMKKADANSAYVQVGSDFTSTTINDSVSVHLTDWVNRRYKVQACDANAACTDSSEVIADSAMLSAITYLKSSNSEANDWFGWSVTISGDGNTMAIGAPAESSNAVGINGDQTSNTSPTSGAVYVFVKINGNWTQEAYLKSSYTEQAGDGITTPVPNFNTRFGYQVALSADGNTLAVSAINDDSISIGVNCPPYIVNYSSSASNSQSYVTRKRNYDIGAVYVFTRSGAQWSQQAYIKPLWSQQDLSFGYSLTLSGDGKTLAVGTAVDSLVAAGINPIQNSSSSAANLCIDFSTNSSLAILSSSSSSSVSSSSSSSNSSSSAVGGSNSGAVYIYKLVNNVWTEDAYLKASDSGSGDFFGTSLALSADGKLLAVGAPGEDSKDSNATDDMVTIQNITESLDTGGVYLFKKTDGGWIEQPKIKPSNPTWLLAFGSSVALSADGNILAVGAPGDWSKAVGVNGNSADFTYDVVASADGAGNPFLSPSSISSYGTGAVFVFTNSGTAWLQEAYIKPLHGTPGYQFGSIVSLSGNGNVLAAGSWVESSLAKGINGDTLDTSSSDSGAAYAFTRTGTTWSQKSYIKAPNSDAHDRFGRALKLDDSGENLLIGAYRESSKATGVNGDKADNSAGAAGAAYIY